MKIATLLLTFAACFFLPLAHAADKPAATSTIEAVLVVASKAPGKPDPRLAAYEATLRRVLRFESFQFLGRARATLAIPG